MTNSDYKIEPSTPKVKQVPFSPPKKPSAFARFRHRLWEDVVSSFWKGFAYFALFCCACFGYYQWYFNQKYKPIVKEYVIVRTVLEGDPDFQNRLKNIDSFINENDLDEIYERAVTRKKQQ